MGKVENRKVQQSPDYYYHLYFSKKGFHHVVSKKRIDDSGRLIPEGKSILEAGCGCGVLSKILQNKRYVGVDLDREAIIFAQKNIQCGTYICADLKTFDLKNEFDVIFSSNVLEHFSLSDRATILRRLDAHLKQDGIMILIVPSYFFIRFVEAPFKLFRRLSDNKTIFDDEDIHGLVDLRQEVQRTLSNYRILKEGLLTFKTMKFIIMQKAT